MMRREQGYAAIRWYDSSPSLKVNRRRPEITLQAAAKQPSETQATFRQLVIVVQYYTSYSDAMAEKDHCVTPLGLEFYWLDQPCDVIMAFALRSWICEK